MKFCGKCGTKVVETQKFCAKCGAPVNNVNNVSPQTNASNTTNSQETFNNNVTGQTSNNKINADKTQVITNQPITQKNSTNSFSSNVNSNNSFNSNTNTPPRKPINKSLIFIPVIIIAILVGALFGTKAYFSNKFSPKAVITKFQDAVLTKDTDLLESILYSLNDKLDLTENDANAIIKYLSEDSSNLNAVISTLNNDSLLADNLTSKGSPLLLADNELFALTITSKNFLFTKYAVIVRPVYLDVESNNLAAKIYIADEEKGIISNTDSTVQVGPIAPGIYDVTLKTTDVFGNELSETLSTAPSDLIYGYPLSFFEDYIVSGISTNVPEATIFVNGKDTGKVVNDYLDGFGPLNDDDTIYLSYTANDITYTTKERSAYSYYSYIDLDFSYTDYEKIKIALSGVTSETVADFISEYASKDYIISTSNTAKLDFKALNNYTADELFIARNEMFARYGYVFTSSPNLQSYFESKSWYTPNSDYSGDLTGELEQDNVNLIKSIEFLKMAHASCPSITSDYVFPNSNTVEISSNEASALTDWELIVARNEIYARYGLNFSTKELVDHFKSKSWFTIDSSVGNDLSLNSIESKNVATILAEEKNRMNSKLNHDLGE